MRLYFFLLRFSIVCALVLSLTIALTPGLAQEELTEDITLVIWGEPGTVGCITDPESTWEFCNYVRALNDSWQDTYPHIHLQWEAHDWDTALYENLQAAIENGTAPDITVGESFMPPLARNGYLVALNLPDDLRNNLIPATVNAVAVNDELYGVAAFTALFTLEINADVFLQAGLDPATTDLSTWDAVSETAATITEAGGGAFYGFSILGSTPAPAAAMFRAAPYLYQAGAEFCNVPVCDTPTLNGPAAIPVYEWFRELYQYTPPDLVSNGDEGFVFSQLFAGVTAMQTAGSWHPGWAQGSGCEDCRYYPLPLPENGQRANVVVGNAIYSILSSSEYQEEATLFLEWLVSDDVQNNLFWTGVGGRLPTTYTAIQNLQAAMEGDTSTVPAFYAELPGKSLETAPAEAVIYDVFIDELLNGDVRILPPWASHTTELNTLWNEMFMDILTTDKPIPDILDAYQVQAEAIIKS